MIQFKLRQTSWIVLMTYWGSLLTPSVSFAIDMPHGFKDADSAKFSVKCIDDDCSSCKQFCSMFDGKGIGGSNTWDTSDDQLCADMGGMASGASKMPTPNASYRSCSVNVTDRVLEAIQSNPKNADGLASGSMDVCRAAQQAKDMCTFHNSQVQNQCMAVNATDGKNTSPMVASGFLLSLDLVAAAACTYQCVSQFVTGGISTVGSVACEALGLAEGAVEIGVSMGMSSGKVGDYISTIGGGLGMAGAGVAGTAAVAAGKLSGAAEKKATQISAGGACVTAAIFLALAAVRAANIAQMRQSLQNSCSNVDGLLGNFQGVNAGPSGGYTPPPGFGGGSGYGGSSGGGSGGGGSGPGGGGISQDQYNALNKCMGQGGAFNSCLSAATGTQGSGGATDANLLSNVPGAANQLMSKLPEVTNLTKKAISEGMGAAAASMMPPNAGDMGNALVGVAQAAQEDAAKLAAGLGMGMTSSYSGGGGGAAAASKSADNPFGNLFGGGAAGGGGAQGPSLAAFGNVPGAPDIWHTNTHMNLFEIVSDKIGKVSNRVK